MGERRLTAAVVGGGIGGLAAAAAMLRAGIDVSVYEQAPELGDIGAGVLLGPNSVRLLNRLGLADAIAAHGGWVGQGSTYYRHDGTPVAPIMTTDSSGWAAMYGMHRADLVEILGGLLPAECVHLGHRATGFEQTASAGVVTFDNGAGAAADIVIGADGIHPVLQRFVTTQAKQVFSGSVAYRGLIAAERLPQWRPRVSQLWMGEGKHFLVYPLRAGKLINFVGFVPADEEMRESWSAPGDPDALRAAFHGWDEPVTGLLEQVDLTYWWGLYDREPLERWTNGRLALSGDAAHPMLPHLGQGANQSIEDGFALAAVLKGVSREDVPSALEHYAKVRRRRTDRVQHNSRQNGERYDLVNRTVERRDNEIAETRKLRAWIYDYDVEAEPELARTSY